MARRAGSQRIFAARRAAIRDVLASEGMTKATAEARCDAWQDEAERLGLDRGTFTYWGGAADWVDAESG